MRKIRKISTIFLCLVMVAMMFAAMPMNIGAEQEPEIPEEPVIEGENEWWVEGSGTYFEITNSPYLNVTLTSSENVYIHLESIAEMVSYYIEVDGITASTEITISGFEPSKIYYRYQDGNLEDEFTADESGSYAFTQDISTLHHVFIKETKSTIYIDINGNVVPSTAPIHRNGDIYTLQSNIYDTIIIQKSGITLKGNGKTIEGRYRSYGIYVSGCSGITIMGIRLLYFDSHIFLFNSNANTIQDNELLSNGGQTYRAIDLTHSIDNIIEKNTISHYPEGSIVEGFGCRYGIFGPSSDGNTIRGNSISDCDMLGIYVYGDHSIMGNTVRKAMIGINAGGDNTVISGNTVINTGIGIKTSGNTINGNTVDNSGTGIYLYGAGATVTVIGNTVGNCNTGIKVKKSLGPVISDNHFNICITAIDYDPDPCTGLTINGNIIMYGTYGIYLGYSDGNTLSGNTIMYTTYALYLDNSNNNIIFRNNLIGNTYQVHEIDSTNIWDNGEGEGSHWSDYQGEDLDGDGIGDTLLPHNGVDYFPLVNQWFPTPLGAVEVMKEYIRNADLPHKTEKGLISQLDAVENALSNDHEKAAVKILNGFIKHVGGLRNADILTEEQCEYLTRSAQELIEMIES